MCVREIDPKETTRTLAFELWMKAPNPMVTFFKTYRCNAIDQSKQKPRYEVQHAS